MPVSTTYRSVAGKIHQGEGYLFWNILRPLFGMRPILSASKPPTITDPATPAAWLTGTLYATGTLLVDNNNNIELVTAGGTSGTAPTWPTVVGTSVTDSGAVTYEMIGPSFVWAPLTAVIFDQQVRDNNNNIQQVIVEGTTKTSSHPTWSTSYGGITIDGTPPNAAVWMCLGPTLILGGNEGALTFKIAPKFENLMYDQYTAPVDFVTVGEDAEIDGTLEELTVANLNVQLPNSVYNTLTDLTFPATAQSIAELTLGGQLRVPRPCVALVSPKRQFGSSLALSTNPFRYFGGVIYAVGPMADGSLPISLKKNTSWKIKATGSAVTWRPAGDFLAKFFETL